MKWILFYTILTANGVTESQSNFVTQSLCDRAAAKIHADWEDRSLLILTECWYTDGVTFSKYGPMVWPEDKDNE